MKIDIAHWILIHAISKHVVLLSVTGWSGFASGVLIYSSARIIEALRYVRRYLSRLRERLFEIVFAEIIE
ncbi:hypothetical protein HY483_03590 [Candidatus Woesearchaeota archaeon]|nr:hypothetical protein [Candidatus Woesearchaeota archaeon]